MVTWSCGAFANRSLETLVISGKVRILSSSLWDHAVSSATSTPCSVYSKPPRDKRTPTLMSCATCMKRFAPWTLASFDLSRSIISEAVALRWWCGLNTIVNRPVFAVLGLSLLPVCEAKACTSGSLRITSPSSCCKRIIFMGGTSCPASETPLITPVS